MTGEPGLKFKQSLFLAPMAGVNDPVFRAICKRLGADLTYTEMISAAGLCYGGEKGQRRLYALDDEKPVAVQLFGKDPALVAEAARMVEGLFGGSLVLIDLNMGCPVRKVAGKGEGAALMCQPRLAEQIISAVVRVVRLPVTVKFRRGWQEGQENAVEFACRAEAAGAAALAVHGRFAVQMYQGFADKSVVARVKAAVKVPVAASGDVYGALDIAEYFDSHGADAVMVARGAAGNPWIFRGRQPTLAERLAVAREHTQRLYKLEPHLLASMRKHLAWYFKGLPGAAAVRRAVNECRSIDEYLRLLDEIAASGSGYGNDSRESGGKMTMATPWRLGA
ncbi:MAG: tRNA dihydrouridine synthase DusB [Actinomycetia bacterium]|nr:tRNA dihydrouridine synthase DusB [Actinomycetes bacterium]